MNDDLLADLLAMLGVINKHPSFPFAVYSVKPMGKMSFMASGILELIQVANDVMRLCVQNGFSVRLAYKDGFYICTVENSWVTVKHEKMIRAIIEACALTLEGALPKLSNTPKDSE